MPTRTIKSGEDTGYSNSERVIRFAIDTSSSTDSDEKIPANSRVLETRLEILTEYSAGATIKIGYTSDLDAFFETTETEVGTYIETQDTAADSVDNEATCTISGSPSAGAGYIIIKYVQPKE